MRGCITSLVTREVQMKTTVRYQHTSVKWPTILTVGKDMEQPELSYTAGGNVKWYDYFGHAFKS